VSHPDDGEAAMIQLMLDAIPASDDLPNTYGIVQAVQILHWILCYFIQLILVVRIDKVTAIGDIG
jgi:hypothetical protein